MTTTLSNVTVGAPIAAPAAAAAPVAPALLPAAVAAKPNDGVTIIDDKTAVVVDSAGHSLKVRRPSAIEKMRILRIVGAEGSDNNRYVGYATLAAAVREIDGVPVAFPFSLVALEATVTRLDEEGLAAVGKALMALTPALDTEAVRGL